MIVFGSRMYFTKNVVKSHHTCVHCGKYGPCRSYDARKFGHLYFIPLIPSGGPVRVFKECGKCKMGQHVPVAQATKFYQRVEALLPACLEAASRGEREFTEPGQSEPIHTAALVAEAVDVLATTGHAADVPGIIDMFRAEGAAYEAHVAQAAHQQLSGQLPTAESAMLDAHRAAPQELYPLGQLADFAALRGDAQAQLGFLEQALALAGGDDAGILLAMTGPLEQLKRFDELVALLDRCIEQVPELQRDKKFMKLHKKYGKKARKMGA